MPECHLPTVLHVPACTLYQREGPLTLPYPISSGQRRLRKLSFWNVLSIDDIPFQTPFGRGAAAQSLVSGNFLCPYVAQISDVLMWPRISASHDASFLGL